MEIEWVQVEEFPNYSISNFGDVVNEATGRVLRQSTTIDGTVKVNIMHSNGQSTRSVKVLVADAFVLGKSDFCNTPIHLDGNSQNNQADNIRWRPRDFAWRYKRQFIDIPDKEFRGPIRDVETRDRYLHVYEAAVMNGLLFEDIWKSIRRQLYFESTFPTHQRFELI